MRQRKPRSICRSCRRGRCTASREDRTPREIGKAAEISETCSRGLVTATVETSGRLAATGQARTAIVHLVERPLLARRHSWSRQTAMFRPSASGVMRRSPCSHRVATPTRRRAARCVPRSDRDVAAAWDWGRPRSRRRTKNSPHSPSPPSPPHTPSPPPMRAPGSRVSPAGALSHREPPR